MTRNGRRSTRQYCGGQPAQRRKRAVAHRVDPAVEHVQTTGRNPPINRPLTQAETGDLASFDHAVLYVPEPPDRSIDSANANFPPHSGVNFSFAPHGSSLRLGLLRI